MQILQTGSERGITLIEVLIVLLVITIIISLNLPEFQNLIVSVERRGQIHKVEHFFYALREKSILLHRELVLEINDNGLLCKDEEQNLSIDLRVIEKNTEKVIFYPDGSCSGGRFSISISDRYKYRVIVDPVTAKLDWSVIEERSKERIL